MVQTVLKFLQTDDLQNVRDKRVVKGNPEYSGNQQPPRDEHGVQWLQNDCCP